MANLTIRTVAAIKAADRDIFVWDDGLPGFGLRVKPSGVKSYLVQYRNRRNTTRRYTIERNGVIGPEEARRKAKILLAKVQDGADPSAERREALNAPTMGELTERYMDEYAMPRKKPSSVEQDERNIRCHILPALGRNKKVADVSRQDVMKMVNRLKDTPGASNRHLLVPTEALNAPTMGELTERYMDEYAMPRKKPSSVEQDERKGPPGFGLRVKPSGVKSYLVQYRNQRNATRRYTIGRVAFRCFPHASPAFTEARRGM